MGMSSTYPARQISLSAAQGIHVRRITTWLLGIRGVDLESFTKKLLAQIEASQTFAPQYIAGKHQLLCFPSCLIFG